MVINSDLLNDASEKSRGRVAVTIIPSVSEEKQEQRRFLSLTYSKHIPGLNAEI